MRLQVQRVQNSINSKRDERECVEMVPNHVMGEMVPNRIMDEMVLDRGGQFIIATIFGLHT